MLHAERVKRKPHITTGLAAELAHHRQVAIIGADYHAAAEEVEDRALGRLRMFSHDQAGKAVYRDRFIICLAVGGRKKDVYKRQISSETPLMTSVFPS